MLPQLLQQFVQKAAEGTLRIRVDQDSSETLRREIRLVVEPEEETDVVPSSDR